MKPVNGAQRAGGQNPGDTDPAGGHPTPARPGIAAFLTAQLDDDVRRNHHVHSVHCSMWDTGGSFDLDGCDCGLPGRVLREVEAKRAILASHQMGTESYHGEVGYICTFDEQAWPCETLRSIAAIYSDHPDYHPAWNPA